MEVSAMLTALSQYLLTFSRITVGFVFILFEVQG